MNPVVDITEANFKHEVLHAQEPVIAAFWSKTNAACAQLMPLLNEVAAEQRGSLKLARVNVDENRGLAAQFHVQSLPTLLYFYNGLIQDHTFGVIDKRVIVSRVEAMTGRSSATREQPRGSV